MKLLNPRVIRNTNVCVVGGAGFLGSHLVEYLRTERNCSVLVIDNLVVGNRKFLHPSVKFLHHDITTSEDVLRNSFNDHNTQFVFNYAAYPYIPVSYKRPLHVFNVNANGAIKVINAAQESGVEAILQVSSAEIYGDGPPKSEQDGGGRPPQLINEECLVRPHSSYGVAKAAVDSYCQCSWRERQTPVIALRQFNCVGERETHPYVVPEILKQVFAGWWKASASPLNVYLGNNSKRDFMYAGDAVRMATELLEKGTFGQVYNLGSQEAVSIYDLPRMITEVSGEDMPLVEVVEDPTRKRPWEIWHLQSDNTKIYNTIEARPTVSLEEALRRTVAYYRGNGYRWAWE